jgi:hypothetical protein
MQTLQQFAAKMEKMPERIKEAVSDVTSKMVMQMVVELGESTPVDTSQAISNWQANIGSPRSDFVGPHFAGSGGSTYGASLTKTVGIAAGKTAIRRFGQPVFISNNAPYIRNLNQGSSRQAPAMFVEMAVLRARKMRDKLEL